MFFSLLDFFIIIIYAKQKKPKKFFKIAIYWQQMLGKNTKNKMPQTKPKPLLASVMMNKFKQSISL